MNRSADIVLSTPMCLASFASASAGITNSLGGAGRRDGARRTFRYALDAIRKNPPPISFDRLRHPNVIREEIERLLENITILAEAASLATSAALTDELVSRYAS